MYRKKSEELLNAHKTLVFQSEEKKKWAAELLVAHKEMITRNEENEKCGVELLLANQQLALQNEEKEKRETELLLANRELIFQNEEKEKRASELIVANCELAFQNTEKEKRAEELLKAYEDLKRSDGQLKEYVKGLEHMMFMTSHKVRQPVANILGIANLLDDTLNTPAELKQFVAYLKESASALDVFTRELTEVMNDLKTAEK